VARILVGTKDGIHTLGVDGQRGPTELAGRSVTFVSSAGDEQLAVLDASEIWRRAETGWSHVATIPDVRLRCLAYTDRWLVGTSEAHLLQLGDDVPTRVETFEHVAGRESWYTPWGGPPDVRSMSEWDEHVYVNVHVGGIVHTDDGGDTWGPTIDIDADVHQVTTTEGMVLAACAEGLAVSEDSGASWTYRTDGLAHRYARAVTVWGDMVLVSTSRGPRGGEAAVYRAPLDGGAFERCRTGLPEWFDDNIDSHCLDSPPDGPIAAFGTSDGRVFRSMDVGASWEPIAEGVPTIQRVLVVP
jgi:hypothetical protein